MNWLLGCVIVFCVGLSGISAQNNPFLEGLTCIPNHGLSAPIPECSVSRPCTRNLFFLNSPSITTSVTIPICSGGSLQQLNVNGNTRYFCQVIPLGDQPRPLVIWVHGAGTNAGSVFDLTKLPSKANTFQLSKNPSVVGFNLVSTQGRNLNWPTEVGRSGPNYDYYFRGFNVPSTNPDIAFFDALIDNLVHSLGSKVDPTQIYLLGWSAGGSFALLYSIIRYSTPTLGGNTVSGAAVYSSGDPFENPIPNLNPSCKLNPYPTANVPILEISRDCDLLPCNQAQSAQIASNGKESVYPNYPLPDTNGIYIGPGDVISQWIDDLRNKVSDSKVQWLLVNSNGDTVTSCNPICSGTAALASHGSWPSGNPGGLGGIRDLEINMLQFLSQYSAIQRNTRQPSISISIAVTTVAAATNTHTATHSSSPTKKKKKKGGNNH